MLKLKVKSSVRPSKGNNDGVPKKSKKTFVRELKQRELDAPPAWFGRFRGEHSWWDQPPVQPASRQRES